MNPETMTEREFGLRIRNKLNASLGEVDACVAGRLWAARRIALERHAAIHAGPRWAVLGRDVLSLGTEYGAPLALAFLLLLGVLSGDYLARMQRIHELEAVDSALLADDLPIAAYLDKGFETWLRMSEAQADASEPR